MSAEIGSKFHFVEDPNRLERATTFDERIDISLALLRPLAADSQIAAAVTKEALVEGLIPRLTPFDMKNLPEGVKLVRLPEDQTKEFLHMRSYDVRQWNRPEQVLSRLRTEQEPFIPPVVGNSRVMDRLKAQGLVVSFDDLRVKAPAPEQERQSRTAIVTDTHINIMGQARIPFAVGSVPDVGNALSYFTMAQSHGMVFASRDMVLSDPNNQQQLVKQVITALRTVPLHPELYPNEEHLQEFASLKGLSSRQDVQAAYEHYLRESWVGNIGVAIEASKKGVKRAKLLHEVGSKLFRVYSPEGGLEIVDTIRELRQEFGDQIKIVGGQIMDVQTAQLAQKAGSDALLIGVAGGRQCTTSVNADIPVETPGLLYELRGRVDIPVGIEGGGVGTHLMTAYTLGASFVCKPGEIGISYEGLGGEYALQDKDGNILFPYRGEASDAAKWWGGRVDALGRPLFVEGEKGVRVVADDLQSMTRNIFDKEQQLAVGLVFARQRSIADLHRGDASNIVQVTPDASALSQAYAH